MTDDDAADLALDGNAAAGLLHAYFGRDATAEPRGCQSCGQTHAVGRHRLYRGAGLVLRCPACGDIAALLVELPGRVAVQLHGEWGTLRPHA
jgi:hypothetical protein